MQKESFPCLVNCDNDKMHSKAVAGGLEFVEAVFFVCESCFVFSQIHKQNVKFKVIRLYEKKSGFCLLLEK